MLFSGLVGELAAGGALDVQNFVHVGEPPGSPEAPGDVQDGPGFLGVHFEDAALDVLDGVEDAATDFVGYPVVALGDFGDALGGDVEKIGGFGAGVVT